MSRLCAVLPGIAACCVLLSHSGHAAQPKAGDSAQQATMSSGSYAPLEVGKMSVDTVGLGVVSTVSISVQCWPGQVKNVTARIVPDSGYEIVVQPQETYAQPDTEAVVFMAMIRATARGIWKVGVEAGGSWPDTSRIRRQACFYIQISDSLCRVLTSGEYVLLQSPSGKTKRNTNRDKAIYGRPTGPKARPRQLSTKQDSTSTIPKTDMVIDTTRCTRPRKAAPAPTDSLTKKVSTTNKLSL